MNEMERSSHFLGEYCDVICLPSFENGRLCFARLSFLWINRHAHLLAKIFSDLTVKLVAGVLKVEPFPVLIDSRSPWNSLLCKTVTLSCDLKPHHLQFCRWKDMFPVKRMQTSLFSPKGCYMLLQRQSLFNHCLCNRRENRSFFFFSKMFAPCLLYSQLPYKTLGDCMRAFNVSSASATGRRQGIESLSSAWCRQLFIS